MWGVDLHCCYAVMSAAHSLCCQVCFTEDVCAALLALPLGSRLQKKCLYFSITITITYYYYYLHLFNSKRNCQEGVITSLVSNMNLFIFYEISTIKCHFIDTQVYKSIDSDSWDFYKIPDTRETVLEQMELSLPLDFVVVIKINPKG